ncbi:MAG: low molecular weight phosphotyrosine protein phosphatase [Erythrobacter sp.]|nr:low molecular weight phosphotyrosine protein phosphatase [Erythrobacter sp.]
MTGVANQRMSVLFVCLGNICRSPMAEGAFRAAAHHAGLDCIVDSAGTASYHLGDAPDHRAIAVARAHGIEIGGQAARQIKVQDFHRFDHIIAMDSANLEGIKARAPRDGTARISMLFDAVAGREGVSVPDPYHGTADDFSNTWIEINEGVTGLVQQLRAEIAGLMR